VRLHYVEAGSGPGILFVPGWTMPAEIWEHQLRHFAARYRVAAMDPRAQGESDKVTEGHYAERRALDIKEVVEHLRLAPAVLVGWSMAVPEALSYVGQFGTSTLSALVLVDGVLGGELRLEELQRRWERMKSMQENRTAYAKEFVQWMYKKPQPEEYLARITAASLKTPTNTAVTLQFSTLMFRDYRKVLSNLDRPVLYASTAALQSNGEEMKRLLPTARVEVFENCGHALFVDDAERFNTLVEEFLKDGGSR
jgi:microsomal epoxide hydrolase